MKQHSIPLRLLAFLLTGSLLLSLPAPAVAAEPGREAEAAAPAQLTAIDPATLHVPKLGELDQAPAPAEEPPALFAPDDTVRVSILLEGDPALDRWNAERLPGNLAARACRAVLRANQDKVQHLVEAALGRPLEVKWNLTLAMNLISANVRYGDLEAIRAVPGVQDVVLENRYEVPGDPEAEDDPAQPNTANSSENMVGATLAWAAGYTGAGTKIAIIDTGLDIDHQSVNAAAFDHAIEVFQTETGKTVSLYTQADLNAVKDQLNGSAAAYLSTKIPYAYNYVDGNTNVTHLQDTQGEHGSHVAGISAANRFILRDGAYLDAAETVHAVGMAPDAQLFVMKVFGANGGAYDSDYMAAIEDAIVLGCDVVNLSLGSGAPGFTTSDAYQDVMNRLADGSLNPKLVASISAGNSYAFPSLMDDLEGNAYAGRDLYIDDIYMHTGGSPGSFTNSLCVAAAENTGITGAPLRYNDSLNIFFTETASAGAELSTVAGTYDLVYIDAMGSEADYAAVNSVVSLEGKVMVVNRGGISFYEKGNYAVSYKPKALIVANNVDGSISMSLDSYTGSFPMVSITKADADAIKAHSGTVAGTVGTYTYYTGSITISDTVVHQLACDNAEITDFSSWGVPGSLIMKPEITSPGGDIYSIWGTNKTADGTAGGTDKYELMSGTSMAAPHITGLVGVLAEYLAETGLALEGRTTRQLIQSLMMSTAVPMRIGSADGPYYPTIQQGAGLSNVYNAIQAQSVLFMNEDATASWADGKVKAELGDKPSKAGTYAYSFELVNLADEARTYELRTDLFTQARYEEDGEAFMSYSTADLAPYGWYVTYDFVSELAAHDVNADGVTNEQDADALLACAAGSLAAADLNGAAADLDGDGALTSRDAYLLLAMIQEGNALIVPAHGSKTVTVVIHIPADTAALDADYPSGCYLEGFTYVTCASRTEDGALVDVEHSIPILGFYSSWTDPSMFDTMSYVDGLYGATRTPYSGVSDTNYLTLTYNGVNAKFAGNPYMVEDAFPADRLAINSGSALGTIAYNLVRSAGTLGFAVSRLDETGSVTEVVSSAIAGSNVTGMWFAQSQLAWQNASTKFYTVNKTVDSYGLTAGDRFRVGFYAIPEYNAMQVNEDAASAGCGVLDNAGFRDLLGRNVLGDGAFVGYDFVVDDEAPAVTAAELTGSTLTVAASDDRNLAYIAVLSLDGKTVYAQQAPGAPAAELSLDASQAIADAKGYVAVFAGDYAGNEAAVVVQVNDDTQEDKTVFILTDAIEAGKEYVICERDSVGTGHVLAYSANALGVTTISAPETPVHSGIVGTLGRPYLDSAELPSTAIWTASNAVEFTNDGYYLGRASLTNSLEINKLLLSTQRTWAWDGDAHTLSMNITLVGNRYLRFTGSGYELGANEGQVYLFEKAEIIAGIQPEVPAHISLTPEALDLYRGNTVQMVPEVLPLTAEDRSVIWTSSDETVVTVDENGYVTAVGPGSALVTATSNANPAVKADCPVSVTVVPKELNGIVWDEVGGVYFSSIQTDSLPAWTRLHENAGALPLTMAFMKDADSLLTTGALYAGTFNSNSYTSEFYSIDRSTYEPTLYGVGAIFAFDIARGSSYVGIYECDVVYSALTYMLAGMWDLYDYDEDGAAETAAMPLVMTDMTEYTDGAYIAAVAQASTGLTPDYYFLDENGVIWKTTLHFGGILTLLLNPDDNYFEAPTKVLETGIATSFLYQNLYYDGAWLYWGHMTGNEAELILINPDSGKLYHAGSLGDGVWPLTGLYVDGKTAPNGTDNLVAQQEETVELPAGFRLQPAVTLEELLTPEAKARIDAEAARWCPSTSANLAFGSVNGLRAALPARSNADPAGAGESSVVTLALTEAEAACNGLITVTYDPAALRLLDWSSDLAHIAGNPGQGQLTLAYADLTARTELATLRFAFEGDQPETAVTIQTAQRNDDLDLEETRTLSIENPVAPAIPFTDVPRDAYYYAPVVWAYNQSTSITAGTGATTFSPDQACTRAQIVTFLWRAAGSPRPTGTESPFRDVHNENAYYHQAVLWAWENGIAAGTSGTTFGPNEPCTRAQAVTFLWRAAGSPEPTGTECPFQDVPEGWYRQAVLWAVEQRITAGTGPASFSPAAPCSRAQIVTFLYRWQNG